MPIHQNDVKKNYDDPAPQQLHMGVDGRKIRSENLGEEFPAQVVSQLPVGYSGAKADFVAWHHYARRLNELFPLEWGSSISHVDIVGEFLLMVVDVRILGVTYSGTGQARADKQNWGGAHAEAFSQAFRRGCALAGLGLYFYGKEEMDALRITQARLAEREKRISDTEAYDPHDGQAPHVTPIDKTAEPTDHQMNRLKTLGEAVDANGFDVFRPDQLVAYRERVKTHYNRGAIGLLIREMKGVVADRTSPASETS